ncbi:protein tyrosine phosphatase family protein [uncultured Pseudoteredinibacter sp.]|uniref:protein tyrosine phosphatase family protein n=1 Tax=uncultured Pseudoteredinibacter sp. TaxID=1641701 RepID=UPI00261B050A|nr:protein tyrosine phosphatase family protein [uncultured Pseudoteredinibacter sp.]
MDVVNYYQVSKNIASSGQPAADQFESIANAGYDVVFNLAMPDHEKSIANEGSIVTSLGMSYIHIPVPFDAPNEDHFTCFAAYMDSLKYKKVWLHCIVNARVSAFLFRYLQEQGCSALEAKTPILEYWLPTMDDKWKAFISHAKEAP